MPVVTLHLDDNDADRVVNALACIVVRLRLEAAKAPPEIAESLNLEADACDRLVTTIERDWPHG